MGPLGTASRYATRYATRHDTAPRVGVGWAGSPLMCAPPLFAVVPFRSTRSSSLSAVVSFRPLAPPRNCFGLFDHEQWQRCFAVGLAFSRSPVHRLVAAVGVATLAATVCLALVGRALCTLGAAVDAAAAATAMCDAFERGPLSTLGTILHHTPTTAAVGLTFRG